MLINTLPALSQFFACINEASINAAVHRECVKYINELSVCGGLLHRRSNDDGLRARKYVITVCNINIQKKIVL